MRSSLDSRRMENDNQFLEEPQTQRSRLKDKQRLSEDLRAKYIYELQQRNRRLKVEIIKINETLAEETQKQSAKKEPPKLIPFESNTQVLRKELQCAYKQIKTYEKDIQALETKQAGGLITERMSRMENILKEKNDMIDKLRSQLAALTKTSIQHSKKLKDNVGKEELETQMLKYNHQIKNLRQKVRQAEQRQKKKQQNAKKQFDYIKNIQKQLIQNGVSTDELQEIGKRNIFNNIFVMAQDRVGNRRSSLPSELKQPKQEKVLKEGEIEDLTVDRYNMFKNDIRTYKKLQQDYQKKLEQMVKQREDQENSKVQVRMKLIEKQSELQQLEQQFTDLKQKVKKIEFKPKPVSVKGKEQSKNNKVTINYGRVKPKLTEIESDTHGSLKYDQKGVKTEKGLRFSDRQIIGKNFNSRIVGVRIWTQKLKFYICGIQCIYQIGSIIKPGGQHVNMAGRSNYNQLYFEMTDGDFLKDISGHLGPNNIIEYLVFISKKSQTNRYGVTKADQMQFNFDIRDDEIPVCVYGSLITKEEPGRPDISLIEHLGFEIVQNLKSEKSSV